MVLGCCHRVHRSAVETRGHFERDDDRHLAAGRAQTKITGTGSDHKGTMGAGALLPAINMWRQIHFPRACTFKTGMPLRCAQKPLERHPMERVRAGLTIRIAPTQRTSPVDVKIRVTQAPPSPEPPRVQLPCARDGRTVEARGCHCHHFAVLKRIQSPWHLLDACCARAQLVVGPVSPREYLREYLPLLLPWGLRAPCALRVRWKACPGGADTRSQNLAVPVPSW